MDKKVKTTLIIFVIAVFLIGFIDASKRFYKYENNIPEIITLFQWERETEQDIEKIYFDANGGFGYYCSCGSPVDSYDLCDSYKYDEKTQTIKLKCLPGVKVKKLKVLEYSASKIVLDFNGEKREFKTPFPHIQENPLPFAGIKLKEQNEEITLEFNIEGYYNVSNNTKPGYPLGSDTCFTWKYNEDKKEIELDCQDHTRIIKINKYETKNNKIETELYFEHEDKTYTFSK